MLCSCFVGNFLQLRNKQIKRKIVHGECSDPLALLQSAFPPFYTSIQSQIGE